MRQKNRPRACTVPVNFDSKFIMIGGFLEQVWNIKLLR
ncbi:hypothetical protein ASZ90_020203 [hydrocarbon metagenome]|uniref:Uncharacterized protein n=1 Tax=hydrocarbon metagenome TaxID=938273 RepID=A0A0W8E1S0_9ZZZZ